jgi:hypothetical protein
VRLLRDAFLAQICRILTLHPEGDDRTRGPSIDVSVIPYAAGQNWVDRAIEVSVPIVEDSLEYIIPETISELVRRVACVSNRVG